MDEVTRFDLQNADEPTTAVRGRFFEGDDGARKARRLRIAGVVIGTTCLVALGVVGVAPAIARVAADAGLDQVLPAPFKPPAAAAKPPLLPPPPEPAAQVVPLPEPEPVVEKVEPVAPEKKPVYRAPVVAPTTEPTHPYTPEPEKHEPPKHEDKHEPEKHESEGHESKPQTESESNPEHSQN